MFRKRRTNAQKILEEFPCLWAIHRAWGAESTVRVETIQARLSNPIDRSSAWWILAEYDDAQIIEPIDKFHPQHNLAMVVIAHLGYAAPLFYAKNLFEVKEVGGKKEIIVYKPPKGLNLYQICLNRMAVMRDEKAA